MSELEQVLNIALIVWAIGASVVLIIIVSLAIEEIIGDPSIIFKEGGKALAYAVLWPFVAIKAILES